MTEHKVTPRETFSVHDKYKSGTADLKMSRRKEIRRGTAPNKTKSEVQLHEKKSDSK